MRLSRQGFLRRITCDRHIHGAPLDSVYCVLFAICLKRLYFSCLAQIDLGLPLSLSAAHRTMQQAWKVNDMFAMSELPPMNPSVHKQHRSRCAHRRHVALFHVSCYASSSSSMQATLTSTNALSPMRLVQCTRHERER